jgi:hypothetical protein
LAVAKIATGGTRAARTASASQADDGRALLAGGIGVVDHHRSAGSKRLFDEHELPRTRTPVVPQQILADELVRGREIALEERALAGPGHADQEDDFRHSMLYCCVAA